MKGKQEIQKWEKKKKKKKKKKEVPADVEKVNGKGSHQSELEKPALFLKRVDG